MLECSVVTAAAETAAAQMAAASSGASTRPPPGRAACRPTSALRMRPRQASERSDHRDSTPPANARLFGLRRPSNKIGVRLSNKATGPDPPRPGTASPHAGAQRLLADAEIDEVSGEVDERRHALAPFVIAAGVDAKPHRRATPGGLW